jgi:hypothetical protein
MDELILDRDRGNITPRTQAADSIEAAAEKIAQLPRHQWVGFVALFFEVLEDMDEPLSVPGIVDESAEMLQERIAAGRW